MVFRSLEEATGTLAKLYDHRTVSGAVARGTSHLAGPVPVSDHVVRTTRRRGRRGTCTSVRGGVCKSSRPTTSRPPAGKLAENERDLEGLAERTRYPACLKVVSDDLVHKSDSGGVELNIPGPEALREAYVRLLERVRSRAPDAAIAGVLIQSMVSGGKEVMVGARRDRRVRTVCRRRCRRRLHRGARRPCDSHRAGVKRPKPARCSPSSPTRRFFGALRGEPPCDTESIVDVVLKVSELMCAHASIREIDINPLMVDANGATAVDARVIVG